MQTSRRAKALYLVVTALFVFGAFGLAAAGIWAVAIAMLGMAGLMAGASRGMKTPPRDTGARDTGDD